ncbi:Uncharacterized protein DAT39_005744 [Clarias magur]|uniref:Uncharacterized protein n=1 Tax=Clarias magur TaxID=1594786 RepID=A0A8J4UDX6_CLAMG|nr:Uncharacterized protein DAT39_005744 [Clarias magur]
MPRLQQPGRCCWILALTLAACALLRAHAHPGCTSAVRPGRKEKLIKDVSFERTAVVYAARSTF